MAEPDRPPMVRASIEQDPATAVAEGRRLDRLRFSAVPPAVRVWAFTAALALLTILLDALILERLPVSSLVPIDFPWPLIAAGFCLAELKVIDVHFRREAHSFSLSEFPAVIGLFLLSPHDYILAVVVGSAVALAWFRQPPLKFAFNLTNFWFGATAALVVFHLMASLGGTPNAADWLAAFAATLSTTVLSALTIATAISLSGGAPQFQKLPQMIQFGGLVAVANTSLALLAVSILWLDPGLLWLLLVPLVTVFLAYRAYLSEREKGERLEFLYQSGRILQHSPELDSAIVALLDHAREMFRAERAEVLLHPRVVGEDALRTTSVDGAAATAMVPVPFSADDPIARRIRNEPHAFFHTPGPFEVDRPGLRQAMVAPLRGESGVDRLAPRRQPADRGHDVQRRRPAPARDARQPGRGRPRERPARAVAGRALAAQGAAPLPGLSRPPDRARQPEPLRGAGRRADRRGVAAGGGPSCCSSTSTTSRSSTTRSATSAGDRLLVAVADRVRGCVRTGDLAARLGGDEFAILLEDGGDLAEGIAVCRRILEALQAPLQIDGQELTIGASVGIAAARAESERADELLRNADVAMYTAKAAGKNGYAVFEPTMHATLVERHALASELSKSIGRGELLAYFQPIVALASEATFGVEALVRWRHPTRGILRPDEFVRLAEENGTILALGRWMLEESCREVGGWRRDRGLDRVALSVNLSALQLQQQSFVDDVQAILAETGFPASDLILELTESAMFHDTHTTIARLEALRALGIRIAIDDFGTGYSSLGYLRRFPVDILKIAREFIGTEDSRSDDWALARAIIALGQTLNLRVVAEGIETADQLKALRELGCELGQGYLFGRPADGPTIARHLWAPATGAAGDRIALARRPAGQPAG